MVQSEICSIIDAIYLFENTFNKYVQSSVTKTENTDSVTFSTSGNYGFVYPYGSTASDSFHDAPFTMSCKVVSFTGAIRLVYNTGNNDYKLFSNMNVANGDVLKIVDDGTNITIYKNDTFLGYSISSTGTSRFGFRLAENSSLELTDWYGYTG